MSDDKQKAMQLIIISGRSGSGKSTALHQLEDEGYYCIDNLPVSRKPSRCCRCCPPWWWRQADPNSGIFAVPLSA